MAPINITSAGAELRSVIDSDTTCPDGIGCLEGRSILIYGAGNYGRIIYRLLTENGIPKNSIKGFLDTASVDDSELFALPVHRPEDSRISASLRTEAEIIISIYCSIEHQLAIQKRLNQLGYQHIRTCYEVAIAFHIANDPVSRICQSNYLRTNIENIVEGCQFWDDNRSLRTYVNHFLGYANCNVDNFLIEKEHKQYFAPLPLKGKGHKRFIDCGAFDGDTVRDLFEHAGKVENLFLFEPNEQNFNKLSKYIAENAGYIAENVVLFPCGVWDKTEQLRFNCGAAAASSISSDGDSVIQCVAIDEALHGVSPTFIKMDVEGAELRALKGSKSIIRECKPDLAICVYHSLSHFWEIPKLIRQWAPEYRFYLRTYGAAGFETVMYAVAH